MNELLEIIRTLATPVAAVSGVVIAYRFGAIQASIAQQQAVTAAQAARTARNKLKLDLFERRLVIYNIVTATLGKVGAMDSLTPDDERDYMLGTAGAQWLFDPPVIEHIEKTIWHLIVDFSAARSALANCAAAERKSLSAAKAEARRKLLDQREQVDKLFEPYLKLES